MGRAEFYNPATGKREPIKAGSIVNSSGLEYTPDQIKGIDNKIDILSSDVVAHKADKATQNKYGHVKLSDIKTNITDDITGVEYKWGMENGLVYLEEVVF